MTQLGLFGAPVQEKFVSCTSGTFHTFHFGQHVHTLPELLLKILSYDVTLSAVFAAEVQAQRRSRFANTRTFLIVCGDSTCCIEHIKIESLMETCLP